MTIQYRVGNVNRLATTRALARGIETIKGIAGLVIQTHRLYESPSRASMGYKQMNVKDKANCSQGTISNLEQGKSIPKKAQLRAILKTCGFDMRKNHGGHALFSLLNVIRDEQRAIKRNIAKERPQ